MAHSPKDFPKLVKENQELSAENKALQVENEELKANEKLKNQAVKTQSSSTKK